MITDFKTAYRAYCATQPLLPLFLQPAWLDTVCHSTTWDVALAFDKGNEIVGAMPYRVLKKNFFSLLIAPPLSPYLGAWLTYPPTDKLTSLYSFEKKVLQTLLAQLPKNVVYQTHSFHPAMSHNWLPFYWAGFRQQTSYTYRIGIPAWEQALAHTLQRPQPALPLAAWTLHHTRDTIRNKIKKATAQLTVQENADLAALYDLNVLTFRQQGMAFPLSRMFLQALDDFLRPTGQCTLRIAYDAQGRAHAANYVVRDATTTYNLLLGSDPALRQSGAVPLLLHHAILEAQQKSQCFDFEGTMLQDVESVFSNFGGVRTPFSRVFYAKNSFWDAFYTLKFRHNAHIR